MRKWYIPEDGNALVFFYLVPGSKVVLHVSHDHNSQSYSVLIVRLIVYCS